MDDKNQVPEAEDYYEAESDQRVTIIIDDQEKGEGQRRQSYSRYSYSTASGPQTLGQRIKGALFVRLIMFGFACVTSFIVAFQCVSAAFRAVFTVIDLLQGAQKRRYLGQTIASVLIWTLITLSLLVAVIFPALGLGMAIMLLASLDLSSSIQRDLADRLREMGH